MTLTPKRPDSVTVLAARHLDETEGPVQIGRVITALDRSAINTVLRYVARAYNAPLPSCPVCGHLNHDSLQAACGTYAEGHPGCRCVARHSVYYTLGDRT
jgi:hypothetical protein